MPHPFGEIAAGVAVVLALGASTLLVLPKSAPEGDAPHETIAPDVDAAEGRRAAPLGARLDAERVEELERQLSALAAEHKELSERVKTIAREVSQPNRQRRSAR